MSIPRRLYSQPVREARLFESKNLGDSSDPSGNKKSLVGPEDVFKKLISLSFSWAEISNLPASFRMVPRQPFNRIL
jgi:hypothetical protein